MIVIASVSGGGIGGCISATWLPSCPFLRHAWVPMSDQHEMMTKMRTFSGTSAQTPRLVVSVLLAQIATGALRRSVAPLIIPETNASLPSLLGMTEAELVAMLGVGQRGAQRLALAFALHRHLLTAAVPDRVRCRDSETIAAVMRPLIDIDHERLWCLPLDPRCRLIGAPIEIARGDVDGTDAGPRAVCRAAVRSGASSMIVVHNHPTGDPTPSAADLVVTRRIATAARTIDTPLQDHVICASGGRWASLRLTNPELFP